MDGKDTWTEARQIVRDIVGQKTDQTLMKKEREEQEPLPVNKRQRIETNPSGVKNIGNSKCHI